MSCEECPLASRPKISDYVPPTSQVKLMIVGEAPGHQEELEGLPFVGGAGRYLNYLLSRAHIVREACYITNTTLCRPPLNEMRREYMLACRERLLETVRRVNPNCILALGNWALEALTGKSLSITKYRGSVLEAVTGHKVIPTLHPAALMRQGEMKEVVVCDLKKVAKHMEYREKFLDSEDFRVLLTVKEVEEFVSKCWSQKRVALDTETEDGVIVCMSFSFEKGVSYVIPFLGYQSRQVWSPQDLEHITSLLTSLLESDREWIMHNAVFDLSALKEHGVVLGGQVSDSLLYHHVLYSELPHSLGFVASLYAETPYWKDDPKTEEGEWVALSEVPEDVLWEYNARDSAVTLRVFDELAKEVRELGLEATAKLYSSLTRVVSEMNSSGLMVDRDALERVREESRARLEEAQKRVFELVGHEFNLASPKELAYILYDELHIPPPQGKKSTDAATLRRLLTKYKDSPLLNSILDWRKEAKALSSFLDPPLDSEGRVHSTFSLHGTASGRLSSKQPNLQNYTPELRVIFIPSPGKVFVACDYSQLELRIIAKLSQCQELIRAFDEGKDIHTLNAMKIFGVREDEVTRDLRFDAKIFVYGLNYGASKETLQDSLKTRSAKEIESMYEAYKRSYPEIFEWRERVAREALSKRFYETPELFDDGLKWRRVLFSTSEAEVERQAINGVVQSTGALLTNWSLWNFWKWKQDNFGDSVRVLVQLHDSILVECDEKDVESVSNALASIMSTETLLGRFPVEVKVGKNWKEVS